MIRNTLLTFVLIASCFIVSFSYGQQKKIIGQPFSAAYEYAIKLCHVPRALRPPVHKKSERTK